MKTKNKTKTKKDIQNNKNNKDKKFTNKQKNTIIIDENTVETPLKGALIPEINTSIANTVVYKFKTPNYKVKTGISFNKLSDFYMYIIMVGNRLIKFSSLITLLPITGDELLVDAEAFQKQLQLSKNNDHGATKQAKVIRKKIRNSYRQIARRIEVVMNETNDATLAEVLGFFLLDDRTGYDIASISVKNTTTKGKIAVKSKSVKKAKIYETECSLMDEENNIISTVIYNITDTKGFIEGLIRGALYRLRSRPLFSKNKRGVWTGYVEIRIF